MSPTDHPIPLARHIFAGGVNRAAEHRRDAAWIAGRMGDPATRFAPVWEQRALFASGSARAAWLAPAAAAPLVAASFPIFLGESGGVAYFAVPVDDDAAASAPVLEAGEWGDLRKQAVAMEPDEAALLAFARGMAYWHARHGFCGVCGAPTEVRDAGHVRACARPECGAHHFPRTDPAMIVRVEHEGRCLLGRQATWEAGMWSVLAGFVEPGESLEDAVAREVMEEAGVPVADVRYHSSQPWPFPASLMVGFTARATAPDIRVDDELEDVRWFTRDEVNRGVAEGTLRLSSPLSISYRLIRDWLEG